MIQQKVNRVTAAFLLAPILPAFLFYLYVALTTSNGEEYTFWFLRAYIFMGLLIGYPIVLIVMLPVYLFFEHFKIKNVFFYILFGASGGALGYYIGWGAYPQGYIAPVIWGVLSATIFWLIVRPDKTHITSHSAGTR